jgi:iron complex outermembrane recepter protein
MEGKHMKTNNNYSRYPIIILYLAVYLLLPTFIFAQNEEEKHEGKEDTLKYEINQVVVTGTRTQEKIIDIPYSVFKVDRVELNYGKKETARDVLQDVPGLFLQTRYGNHDLRISLRGYGSRSNTGVRGVRILQDGIPVSEPDGESIVDDIDFTSLSSVEVVKGNLSALYANAPGGVINFVTDITFPESFVTSSNQFGGYGLRQNGLKLGLATSGYRFFLSYNYTNGSRYRPHSNDYQHLVNTVYQGYIGTKSLLTILGAYSYSSIKLPGSLTQSEYSADPFQADPLAISQDYKDNTRKGRLGIKFETSFGQNNSNDIEIAGYGGIKESENAGNEFYTFTNRYSVGTLLRYTNKSKIFEKENKLSLGMDYAYQAGPITDFNNVYGNKGIDIQNNYNESLSNIGFYLMDHYEVIENKLDAFLLSRFDKNVFSNNVLVPVFGVKDSTRIMQNLSPKLGLNFKLTPSVALYSSYGLSYDYPALSELQSYFPQTGYQYLYSLNPDLNPQKSYDFEFGIKGNLVNEESDFMKKVFFDITFFKYKVVNEIVPYIISNQTYFRNAGKTDRLGIEAGIKTEPFEGIEMTVNYTFTNFKYDDYITPVYSDTGLVEKIYSGNRVPSIPRHAVNFIFNYEYEISDDLSGLLQWDCDYISKMFVNDANSEIASGYFYGNVMAGMNMQMGNYSLIGYIGVRNIFNKNFIGFINTNDYNGRYYEPAEPRYFFSGINISYKL